MPALLDSFGSRSEPPRAVPSAEERMFDLTYRVARRAGYSRRASGRLCRNMLSTADAWLRRRSVVEAAAGRQTGVSAHRGTRAQYVVRLRAVIGTRVDPGRLDDAVAIAVHADEAVLLPPRQRMVLQLLAARRCGLGQVAEHSGWTFQQAARILRVGLRTITFGANT